MYSVKDVQLALRKCGFAPGPIDGILGRATIAAIRAFQAANALEVDGIAGPRTLDRLFNHNVVRREADVALRLPWMGEATRLKGVHEKTHASTVLGWAKKLGGMVARVFTKTSTAWCGLFVGHCVAATLPDEALPANPLGAREWLKFGVGLKAPAYGAVVVFWRGSKSGWQGHVGFYVGEDDSAIHVLGGNQADQVSVTRIAKSRLLGYRWPKSVPLPTGGAVKVTANGGSLSVNEA